MIISAKTDIGAYRESNQDAFATGTFVSGDAWAVVCDGMGGVSGGMIASQICIDKVSSVIKRGYRDDLSVKSAKNLLQSAITHFTAWVQLLLQLFLLRVLLLLAMLVTAGRTS